MAGRLGEGRLKVGLAMSCRPLRAMCTMGERPTRRDAGRIKLLPPAGSGSNSGTPILPLNDPLDGPPYAPL
jgi:hypothetical protein